MTIIITSKYLVFQFIVCTVVPNKGVETASLLSTIKRNCIMIIIISQSLFLIKLTHLHRYPASIVKCSHVHCSSLMSTGLWLPVIPSIHCEMFTPSLMSAGLWLPVKHSTLSTMTVLTYIMWTGYAIQNAWSYTFYIETWTSSDQHVGLSLKVPLANT